jgi:DNA replication protein DnaC
MRKSLNELLAAQAEHRVEKLLAQMQKQHLLVIDELGFIPFSERGSHLLFQVVVRCTNGYRC